MASLFFYGWWDYHYVPLLLMSILFNYFVGKQIENRANKKAILVGGIAADLLLLGYFKYADFFISTVNDLSGSSLGMLNIVLPLGISF
ncbi:MAG: MBOAT family protein, partial [Selenomonadaceae bacterium]|nr:MBOAT family protein [Selenomonadaceae bacterium]